MIARTPTSSERMIRFIRAVDVVSVLLAGPIAMALRDPSLFSGERLGPTVTYCLIGYVAGLLMVIAFHPGQGVRDHVSAREVRQVVAAAIAATVLTAAAAFSLDRLNYIPRSLPLIQLLVLGSLMLGGRALATSRRELAGPRVKNFAVESRTLLVNANQFALSYLKMLDAFAVDRSFILAVLDRNPKLFGRALLGHEIIGPPSALARVVHEYTVHGVNIDRVLICDSRQSGEDYIWDEMQNHCRLAGIKVDFLPDVLGIELGRAIKDDTAAAAEGQPPGWPKDYRLLKRTFDLSISLVLPIVLSPIIALVVLGIFIDLGWPTIFWQRRIGYQGLPFLIYKFRTLHAPYDRQGNFVEEEQRTSRFGAILRRTRLDELPQLWNVITGKMSLVGPRPLLPVDQPDTSQLRWCVPPGVTGWAQINGGKRISADDKGLLDDWYVRNASFWLDLRIIMRTLWIMCFGDSRRLPPARGSDVRDELTRDIDGTLPAAARARVADAPEEAVLD
jgi:lipopolysaccharide/colanic/teichoic acid biosynthesis glycosyltransferase